MQVTDLRVRLHKKMKMKELAEGPVAAAPLELVSQSAKERLKRAREPDQVVAPEEEDILGRVEPSQKRRVVPPGSRSTAANILFIGGGGGVFHIHMI